MPHNLYFIRACACPNVPGHPVEHYISSDGKPLVVTRASGRTVLDWAVAVSPNPEIVARLLLLFVEKAQEQHVENAQLN